MEVSKGRILGTVLSASSFLPHLIHIESSLGSCSHFIGQVRSVILSGGHWALSGDICGRHGWGAASTE